MNEDTTDRISHLPVPLLHYILFHLPVKEEARTCVLSKSWYQLVWSSLPRRSFDFNHLDLYTPNENERDQKFVNLVEDSLKSLQMGRFKVPAFSILVDLPRFKNASFLDRCLELVARNHVEKLFFITIATSVRNIPYIIPEIALASSTPLQTLELKGCNLQRNSLCDNDDVGNIGPLALEKISLYRVTVDNQGEGFQNFISRCHSLKHLSFRHCDGVKKFQLSNNPKLEIVKIAEPADGILEEIVVDSLCLHTLICDSSYGRHLKVEATRCANLIKLHLTNVRMECNVIQTLATNHPHLKKLKLEFCSGLRSLSVLRHPCLETLKLSFNDLIELDVVDMPNLVLFVYRDRTIPTKLFISNVSSNMSLLEKSNLNLYYNKPPNTLWFLQLKTYLGQFTKHSLTVDLDLSTDTSEFNVDELSDSLTLDDLSTVERLNLVFYEEHLVSYGGFFAGLFLDGIFWSCRPKKITITTRLPFNRDYLKCIYEILLTGREENPDCCNGRRALKCWRHFLKDFAIYVNDETVSSNKIDTSSTESLEAQPLLQNVPSYSKMILNLSWM